jgi:hypothetical protein
MTDIDDHQCLSSIESTNEEKIAGPGKMAGDISCKGWLDQTSGTSVAPSAFASWGGRKKKEDQSLRDKGLT